jgi:hypothetical protein
VVSDRDIYRAANLLIDRHGGDALVAAARMIDRMLGDPEAGSFGGASAAGSRHCRQARAGQRTAVRPLPSLRSRLVLNLSCPG